MAWLSANLPVLLTVLLVLSEAVAAVSQLLWPANKGLSGIVAGIIKLLQTFGAKAPTV
jgi:hypothetical protein